MSWFDRPTFTNSRKPKSYYLKDIQKTIGPQSTWPYAIKKYIYGQAHLRNNERFAVICFLLGNGYPPYMLEAFFRDSYFFDAQAKRANEWIINKFPTSNWTYWNISAGLSSHVEQKRQDSLKRFKY